MTEVYDLGAVAVEEHALGRLEDVLEAAVTSEPVDDVDKRFWGPAPDSVTATRAVFDDLSDQFARRRRLAAEGISTEQAAELLGVSAQSVTAKLASGKLVGIKDRRE